MRHRLLPNSRLLGSDSGGTAYGTSACVTGAYLPKVVLPAKGAVCTGDAQPFVTEPVTGTPTVR